MARFGLSPNQLKLCSASMAKSDNNQMLVCGAEMLRQGRPGEGVCVHVCVYVQQTFLLVAVLFVRKSEIRKDRVSKRDGDRSCVCVSV